MISKMTVGGQVCRTLRLSGNGHKLQRRRMFDWIADPCRISRLGAGKKPSCTCPQLTNSRNYLLLLSSQIKIMWICIELAQSPVF